MAPRPPVAARPNLHPPPSPPSSWGMHEWVGTRGVSVWRRTSARGRTARSGHTCSNNAGIGSSPVPTVNKPVPWWYSVGHANAPVGAPRSKVASGQRRSVGKRDATSNVMVAGKPPGSLASVVVVSAPCKNAQNRPPRCGGRITNEQRGIAVAKGT